MPTSEWGERTHVAPILSVGSTAHWNPVAMSRSAGGGHGTQWVSRRQGRASRNYTDAVQSTSTTVIGTRNGILYKNCQTGAAALPGQLVLVVLVGPRDCLNPEGPDWDADRGRLVLRAVCPSLESARPTPKASWCSDPGALACGCLPPWCSRTSQ